MASPGIVIIRTSAVEVSIQAVSPRSNPAAKAGVACHGSRIDRQATIGMTLDMTRPPVERFLPVVTASHVPNPVSMLHCGNAAESASNSDRRRGDLPNRWADLFRQWQDVATPPNPPPSKRKPSVCRGRGLRGEALMLRISLYFPRPLRADRPASRWGRVGAGVAVLQAAALQPAGPGRGSRSMAEIKTEVLIAGGGMVGMATAIGLARAGIACVLVDAEPAAERVSTGYDGRSSAIAYGSQQALMSLGIWAGMADEAQPILDIRVSDGARSALRAAAGIGVAEFAYAQTGIVCTVSHELPHEGVAHEHFLPAGPFAMLPMTDHEGLHRSSIVWTERRDLAQAMLALDDDGFSAEIERRFGDSLGRIHVLGRRWSYPLRLLHAQSYVAARLALIGDAAHAIHPIAGQGLNLGLRDVAALAEVLADAHRLGLDLGTADVLADYQRWRRFDTLLLIAVTDSLNRLFSTDIAPLRFLRDLGLGAVNRLPPVKRLLMRHAMGAAGPRPRLLRGLPL